MISIILKSTNGQLRRFGGLNRARSRCPLLIDFILSRGHLRAVDEVASRPPP